MSQYVRCGDLAGKSVLVVEDEEIVVDVLREVLGPAVGRFETASNGLEALSKAIPEDFDYILLDIEMPGMNGMEFYRLLNEYKPGLLRNIIFITGDTETEITRNFIKKSGCRFLDKPFMIKELLDAMTCR